MIRSTGRTVEHRPLGPAADPPAVLRYVSKLPPERKRRFEAIRAAIRHADASVSGRVHRDRTVFRKGQRWVALANRARHLAVYVCEPGLLAGIRLRHPELDCGLACVRIRDTQHLPVYELREAFEAAFGDAARD